MKNSLNNKFKDINLYSFVPETDFLMQAAKEAATKYSLTPLYPIGILAVKGKDILCASGNGNGYHESNIHAEGHIEGCRRRFVSQERVKNGGEKIKPGEEFDLCIGCHTDFHAESNLIRKAVDLGVDLRGADMYMYGHYWCCGSCWGKMNKAGIRKVFLPDTYKKFEDVQEVKNWAKECMEIRKANEFLVP
ncbi:MAG: hypothetical protein WC444_02545 [Candidatus Paceibacterota bacterium]